ncbi:MAG TPA: glycosyltransferase [Thermoanaerobaculia bacterium]|jgi:glycosyltransferase involved in cell wall biosynthesis
MRTAVVHDWLNGMRGGEKVLEALLPRLPEPTVFTLFHVPGAVSPGIERYPIRASWLNRLPFARRGYRNYLPLFASAVESFDLSGFDLVVSSSHCVAKGAIARAGAPHLCYCHTPVRYAYDQLALYVPPSAWAPMRGFKVAALAHLREWDVRTASRPTRYLANSNAVADRIRRFYEREATVVHPPVDVAFYDGGGGGGRRRDFLLCVGALVPYKRFDLAIEAARRLKRRLVLVGRGPEEGRLRRLAQAGPSVEFLSGMPPKGLRELYRQCALYLQPGEEDFGISAVEALACGAPVVALGRGGARDVVRDGENGILFTDEGAEGLAAAVERAAGIGFDYTLLRASALPFRPERFADEFDAAVRELLA